VPAARKKRLHARRPAPKKILAAALQAQSEDVFIAARQRGPKGLRIVFANQSFCTMTGHADVDLIGQGAGGLHSDKAELVRLRRWFTDHRPREPLAGEGLLVRSDRSTLHAG
jgi:two-component system, cell cycle sensor histidine kinase and response regulator CckA